MRTCAEIDVDLDKLETLMEASPRNNALRTRFTALSRERMTSQLTEVKAKYPEQNQDMDIPAIVKRVLS